MSKVRKKVRLRLGEGFESWFGEVIKGNKKVGTRIRRGHLTSHQIINGNIRLSEKRDSDFSPNIPAASHIVGKKLLHYFL